MPLNYSKWDMLELSDDSDVEEHPNVDKKSMIRWKQRDIHEKREQRKLQIAKLNSELSLNGILRPRIEAIITGLSANGFDHYRAVQHRIKEAPSDEKPQTGAPNQPTYDMMLGQLLEDWATGEIPQGKKEALKEVLEERLKWNVDELVRRDAEVKKEIEKEEAEMRKKITSDDIHEGWDKSTVNPAKQGVWDEKPKPKRAPAQKKEETIEVLNPKASSSALTPPAPRDEDSDDEEEFGPLSASGRAFANIPIGAFEKSYNFIQNDSSVLAASTHDSLLAEAFDAERRGDNQLAMRCVHQSLLISYCRQLGKDGVGLFFQKMITRNPQSIKMFQEDFTRTYGRIHLRTKEILAEEAKTPSASAERETIQLVATDPSMDITFNIPDGPPPAELQIEGEGAEDLDLDDVRAWLERKWEIFEGFPEDFRKALQTENLEKVNKVLGDMSLNEAEEIVGLLQEGGMLSFSEKGVRDMTTQ
ncbi:cell division cycle protein 37 [Cryptococcus wingfieldii CBS 7118]|uniref:Hsp90 chaperone protein kinase-targeting subunit n=1 Tax=Cryptococcus wingfieldii CBS 7118 TaxID=1295528 RepID=A0A1E3J739_9TREE|nr:cell division cycle protein 37 [Cryptococcus wingfieldii CBS 7118]ODN96495.1 cell division cycle protein 37 [Cryptococcus wingfieldii CBS 7118]